MHQKLSFRGKLNFTDEVYQWSVLVPNSDLIPSLLYKINENQLALEAAILELTSWVEMRGSSEVGNNVRAALETIDKNEEFVSITLAILMTSS